jgi:hypothetical protein
MNTLLIALGVLYEVKKSSYVEDASARSSVRGVVSVTKSFVGFS